MRAEVDAFEAAVRRGSPLTRGQLMARWQGEAIQPAIALRGMRDQPLRSQAAFLVRIGRERLAQSRPARPRRATYAMIRRSRCSAGRGRAPDDERPLARGDVLPGRLGALLADLGFIDELGRPGLGAAARPVAGARPEVRPCHRVGARGRDAPGASAADPYLPDGLRDRLRDAPAAGDGHDRGPAAIPRRLRVRHPTLTLVRRFADDDGRELAPSPYWVETRRLLAAPDPVRRGVTGLVPTSTLAVTGRDLTAALRSSTGPPDRPAAALARRERCAVSPRASSATASG